MNKAAPCVWLGASLLCIAVGMPPGAAVAQAPARAQAPPKRDQAPRRRPDHKALQGLQAQARAALDAGDTRSAARHASALLKRNTDRGWWNYGNVVYEANQILGLAALKEGRVAAARRHLLAAGRTPGSPQLNSFGPEMTLARELLKRGERQAVLDFLDLVARFWATPGANTRPEFRGMYEQHAAKIRRWKAAIRAGRPASLNRSEHP